MWIFLLFVSMKRGYWWAICSRKKRKVGANAMKRVAAGAHLPTSWLFEPAKRPIEPTTAWTAVSSLSVSTRYPVLKLSGVGRALWANSGHGSAQ